MSAIIDDLQSVPPYVEVQALSNAWEVECNDMPPCCRCEKRPPFFYPYNATDHEKEL